MCFSVTRSRVLSGCAISVFALNLFSTSALASSETYRVRPEHTSVDFQIDQFKGVSGWLGKFSKSSGMLMIDTEKKRGAVDVLVDMDSVSTGNMLFDFNIKSEKFLEVDKYPVAMFKGDSFIFHGETPVSVSGTLTLHGITKPLTLKIDSFECYFYPLVKEKVCDAQASAQFDRVDYGLAWGVDYGFKTLTLLRIKVEGVRADYDTANFNKPDVSMDWKLW